MKRYLLLLLLFLVSCENEIDLSGVEAGNATIAGVLRDSSGQPMASIAVSLSSNTGKLLATRSTSSSGRFEFTGLTAGVYRIRADVESGKAVSTTVTVKNADSEVQVVLNASDALPVARDLLPE